jgi:hypothetical protein
VIHFLLAVLGMFNTTTATLEGAEDPGGIFQKKHHILQILRALGLTSLTSLKGSDEDTPSGRSQMLVVFTLVFRFAFLVFLQWVTNRPQIQAPQEELDAEPFVLNETPNDETAENAVPAAREPTAKSCVAWLIERCSRHRDNTPDHDRRRRYEACVAILYVVCSQHYNLQ